MRWLLSGAAVALLVACGPLPRPFKDKEAYELTRPGDGAGVVIAPIDGGSRQFSNELPEAVVDAFHRMNVPASTNGLLNNAYLLEGRAFLRNGQALVFWQLTNREGRLVTRRMVQIEADERSWESADPALLDALAGRTAYVIASLLKPMDAAPVGPETPIRIGLVGVEGAPGDGNVTIARAFRAVFKRLKVPLVDDPSFADVLLNVEVKVERFNDQSDLVRIAWRLSAPDGELYGSINQENLVPHGMLQRRWGGSAYDAVWGAVDAIAATLEDIKILKGQQRLGAIESG